MSPAFYKEVEKKTKLLRADYGGMMLLKDLARELNYSSHNSVRAWLREHAVEGVRRGKSVAYETDQVAKAIVSSRGMA